MSYVAQDEAAEELEEDVSAAAQTVGELHVQSDSEPSEVCTLMMMMDGIITSWAGRGRLASGEA